MDWLGFVVSPRLLRNVRWVADLTLYAVERGLCPRDGRRRPSLHLRLASPARDSRCGCRYAFFTARILSDRSVIKLVTSGKWRAERHCFRSQKWSGELRIEPSGVSKWDRDADFAGGI